MENEDVLPQNYLAYAKNFEAKLKNGNLKLKANKIEAEKNRELARAYKKYREIKLKEGVMDFSDLISNTLKLFRQRPNILSEYRKKFKYILVDEFQDTNISQYQLLKLLAPPKNNPNITVVADDFQSIYKFRGAAVSNILQFMKDYSQAQSVVLVKNYRSTQKF